MSYRLKTTETATRALARIARQQLERCLPVPRKRGEDGAVWVHETRKSLKRTRALLRLFRPALPGKVWRRENGALRDIGRALSAMRERDVLPATAAALAVDAEPKVRSALLQLVDRLGARHSEPGTGAAPVATAAAAGELATVGRELRAARDRLAAIEVGGGLVDAIAAGLEATHRVGRARVAAAAPTADDEALHELRKAVQVHWRQMQLVEAAWPEAIGARVAAARALAEALGEHQDLAVLGLFAELDESGLDAAGRQHVTQACRARQARIRAAALPAARRLFAADPHAFAAEMASLWSTATAEREAATDSPRRPRQRRKAPAAVAAPEPTAAPAAAASAATQRRSARAPAAPATAQARRGGRRRGGLPAG